MGALAAGLGMGIAGSLFGKPKTQNQTSTQTFQMSPWEEDYWKQMTNKATQLANQPYQAYQGQRVAGLTEPQQQGINNAVTNSRSWEAPYNASLNSYANVEQPFSAESVNQYMSPYLGDVIGNIERIGNENFSAPGGVADTIASDFTGLGQFGSKRMGDVMNRAGQLNQRETMGQVSNALNTGYDTALSARGADLNRQLTGAGGLSALAGQRQALENGTSNALIGAGNIEQNQAQKNLDVGYGNYLDARDWAGRQLQLANSVRPPTEGTSTNTQPVPVPNALQNFLSGVGMYNSGMFDDMFGAGSGGGSSFIPNSGASTGFTGGIPTGTYGANPMVPYEWSGSPFRKGGLATLKRQPHVLDYDGDDDGNRDVIGYKRGGWIKGAIKHPGALHAMLGVPKGEKIPAKKLHAAANQGGVLGRRARFAEELEGFHHSRGGVIARQKRGYCRGGLSALAA